MRITDPYTGEEIEVPDEDQAVPPAAPGPAAATPPAGFGGGYGTYPNYPVEATAEAGAPIYNERQREFEGLTDWGRLEADLRRAASEKGLEYHASDLEGVRRNAGYDRRHLGSGGMYAGAIERFTQEALNNYGQRATNTPGGGGGSGGGGGAGNWFGSNAPSSTYGQPPAAFQAPTMAEVEAEPGYALRLSTGLRARERIASARGSLISGGMQRATERFGQEHASNEYQNVYNRRYQSYGDLADRTRNAERDRWEREYGLARLGFDATTAGRL